VLGIVSCIAGVVCVSYSDDGSNSVEASNEIVGDLLALASAAFYSVTPL
jgi:drug/metabolite transporter (DMT)-like permease